MSNTLDEQNKKLRQALSAFVNARMKRKVGLSFSGLKLVSYFTLDIGADDLDAAISVLAEPIPKI